MILTQWPSCQLLSLSEPIALGGEAEIWEVPPKHVAKVYHVDPPPREKLERLRSLAHINPMLQHTIALPTGFLYPPDDPNQLTGYVMPRQNGIPLSYLFDPDCLAQHFPHWHQGHFVSVAANTCRYFQRLHELDIVVGDVSANNILVNPDTTVTGVDADSMQVSYGATVYPCRVQTEDYAPPELQSPSSPPNELRTPSQDHYGMAVLVHQLLLAGTHPFSGRVFNSPFAPIGKRIALGLYPPNDRAARIFRRCTRPLAPYLQHPSDIPPRSSLGHLIVALFEQAFIHGHDEPSIRPIPSDWIHALGRLGEQLVPCPRDPTHRFAEAFGPCPWCPS